MISNPYFDLNKSQIDRKKEKREKPRVTLFLLRQRACNTDESIHYSQGASHNKVINSGAHLRVATLHYTKNIKKNNKTVRTSLLYLTAQKFREIRKSCVNFTFANLPPEQTIRRNRKENKGYLKNIKRWRQFISLPNNRHKIKD